MVEEARGGAPERESPPPAEPGPEEDEDLGPAVWRWNYVRLAWLVVFGGLVLVVLALIVRYTVGFDLQKAEPDWSAVAILGLVLAWQMWRIAQLARGLRYLEVPDEEGPEDEPRERLDFRIRR